MEVAEFLTKLHVRFKLRLSTSLTTKFLVLLFVTLLLLPTVLAQDDVFPEWEEEIAKPDESASTVANNSGLKCDQTFISGSDSSRKNGTFSAPVFENLDGNVRQCLYTFVAAPGERVHLIFHVFNLRGTPPDGSTVGHTAMCIHEYIDLYTEIPDSEPLDLIHSPFGGRYCGQIPPRRRVSLYRTVVVGFFTDKNYTSEELFQGSYFFVKDDRFQIGTPLPRATCSYTINGLVKRQGEIVSPTYPGVYPKDLHCSYKFIGKKGQRIRIEFRDFDLFYGGAHCPFDFVNVYDGADSDSPLIGTYCGQQRNLVLYSTDHSLLITFTTLKRTADSQNRGFSGIFEFSEGFVKLDFINRYDGEHVRGTECDQTILSKKGSSGVVYSPNYPFPYIPNIVCRYYIYGLQDAQHFETVTVEFEKFDIPTTDGSCMDGYLKLYLKGQEVNYAYDKYDADLCGNNITTFYGSDGPRLAMIFSSGQTQGSGFKAKYSFITEYLIPGTPSPLGGCNFTYLSSSRKRGEFNSPRYPSNYPSNITCTYNFVASPNEQAKLFFDQFKVRVNRTTFPYGYHCQEDYLEVYNVFPGGKERLVGRYCNFTAPGPVESDRGATGLKVLLRTDEDYVASGFKARYSFEAYPAIPPDCGANFSTWEEPSGVFSTPNFPEKYGAPDKNSGPQSCHWYIHSRPEQRIFLHFQSFFVEGEPETRGCPQAVVRVWKSAEGPPLELCGDRLTPELVQHVSDSTFMKITFSTGDKMAGARGFRAVWTAIRSNPGCDQFLCANSSFCIASSLRCDGNPNCGQNDDSDEAHCSPEEQESSFVVVSVAVSSCSVLLLVTVCVVCHRKRHRRRRRRRRPHPKLRPPLDPPPFDPKEVDAIGFSPDLPPPPPPVSAYPNLPALSSDVGDTV